MKILRTPDERFANLPGYSFSPHYVEVDGLRIHYLDEGPTTAELVLMLHGEPSWSYLYRKMIPAVVAAGYRVIAPDLVGFGRSDKPAQREDYTYQRHVDWMRGFLETLDGRRINLFCHDWGGLIGLRLVAEQEERFSRIIASNTFLPTGDLPLSEASLRWQRYSQEIPVFDAGKLINGTCVTQLVPEVVAAYNAPFPDESYQAGARQFPVLIPTTPDNVASEPNRRAWEVLKRWEKPFLTAFSDPDTVTRGSEALLQAAIPGAKGQPHRTILGAGHFLLEEKGPELAQVMIDFLAQTR